MTSRITFRLDVGVDAGRGYSVPACLRRVGQSGPFATFAFVDLAGSAVDITGCFVSFTWGPVDKTDATLSFSLPVAVASGASGTVDGPLPPTLAVGVQWVVAQLSFPDGTVAYSREAVTLIVTP